MRGRPRKHPPRNSAAYRKAHAEEMAKIRARKRRDRECRRCSDPAAIDPKTGAALDQCRKHLDEDNKRKKAAYRPRSRRG